MESEKDDVPWSLYMYAGFSIPILGVIIYIGMRSEGVHKRHPIYCTAYIITVGLFATGYALAFLGY